MNRSIAESLASYHAARGRSASLSEADLALPPMGIALCGLEDDGDEFYEADYLAVYLSILESLNASEFTLHFKSDKEGVGPTVADEYVTIACLLSSAKSCDMISSNVVGRASPAMLAGLRRLRRTILIDLEAIFDGDVTNVARAVEDQLTNNFKD